MKLYSEEIALAYELLNEGIEAEYIAEGLGVSVRYLYERLGQSATKQIQSRPYEGRKFMTDEEEAWIKKKIREVQATTGRKVISLKLAKDVKSTK